MPITPVRPQTQGAGPAMQLGQQTYNAGMGLLGNPIAGNGYGQVKLGQGPAMPNPQVAPNSFGFGGMPPLADKGTGWGQQNSAPSFQNTASMPSFQTAGAAPQYQAPTRGLNPYARGMANDITRRTMDALDQNNLAIQGNSVASGGLGGSRQGVAQGVAMGRTADALSGNLSNLYGQMYEGDSNRATQRYGMDLNSFNTQRGQDVQRYGIDANTYLGQRGQDTQRYGMDLGSFDTRRGQDVQRYGMDLNSYLGQRGQDITMRGQDFQNYNQGMDRNLQQYQADQGFYGQQRGQDLLGASTGMNLAQGGLNMQWTPLQNYANVLSPFTGFGNSSSTTSSGGGWQGALGGALSGYALSNYFK